MVLKPFKIGDLIEAQNKFGVVQEIDIAYTIILTSQNQTIHLPNGALSTGVINNFTHQKNLRIDLQFPVADDTDIEKARQVALEVMREHPNVISDPAPDVKVLDILENGILLVVRPRMKIKSFDPDNPRQLENDYYSVFFGVREAVKSAFQKNGIQKPSTGVDVKK